MHGRNGLKFAMLIYDDHLQNWFDFGQGGVPQLLDPQIYLFIFILLYPKKWERQISTYENYPVTERRVSLTAVLSDFSSYISLWHNEIVGIYFIGFTPSVR